VNTIHVWAAYREAKNIYEIEPTLAACLARSPWPEQTPAQALRLPSRCPVIVIPRPEGDPSYVAAIYDLLTGEEQSGALELRISEFMKAAQLWVPICVLHLNHERLAECLDAAAAEAERHGAPVGEAETVWRNELAGLTLTMLLYLGGEPDLVRIVHPGEKLIKAKKPRCPFTLTMCSVLPMASKLAIDGALLNEAVRIRGHRTKRATSPKRCRNISAVAADPCSTCSAGSISISRTT
jgi:hypothetical protein